MIPAATICGWGDIEYTYGNVPESGFSAFAIKENEHMDMTPYCASGKPVVFFETAHPGTNGEQRVSGSEGGAR